MNNKLCKLSNVFFLGVLVFASGAQAETEWNPSISETEKAMEIKRMEAFEEKTRKGVLEVWVDGLRYHSGTGLTWIGVLGRTNLTAFRPLPSQAFDMQLFDENGKEIKKTWYGRQFGETAKPDKKLLDGTFRNDPGVFFGRSRELRFDHGAGESQMWSFNAVRAFKIKEPGEYRLLVTVRLFVKDTNGVFQPLILPPVSKQLKVLIGK